ncbi:MAG TPA: hypothetical protein VGP10_04680 [Marisediminicola sp.]|jgi:hypothetical protein|nr:hypothetical protein [Marisediminicola sp.]
MANVTTLALNRVSVSAGSGAALMGRLQFVFAVSLFAQFYEGRGRRSFSSVEIPLPCLAGARPVSKSVGRDASRKS